MGLRIRTLHQKINHIALQQKIKSYHSIEYEALDTMLHISVASKPWYIMQRNANSIDGYSIYSNLNPSIPNNGGLVTTRKVCGNRKWTTVEKLLSMRQFCQKYLA